MKTIVMIFLTAMLSLNMILSCQAIESGIAFSEISPEEEELIKSKIMITIVAEEIEPKQIECFDINENGVIALGIDGMDYNIINIYSNEMKYQFSYKFKTNGLYQIKWEGDKLWIYLVRGDYRLLINYTGQIENIQKISYTNEYWNDVIKSTKIEYDGAVYEIRKPSGVMGMLSFGYSKLVKTEVDGTEQILYNSVTHTLTNTFLFFGSFILIIIAVILYSVRYYISYKKKLKQDPQ